MLAALLLAAAQIRPTANPAHSGTPVYADATERASEGAPALRRRRDSDAEHSPILCAGARPPPRPSCFPASVPATNLMHAVLAA
eukprot:scaffold29229_cov101-Isochrysis_galbana.AAC.5